MSLVLKPNREKSLQRRHPWIFSGAVQRVDGDPEPGETVKVLSVDGQFLAHAAYSPHSQIVARVWSWQEAQTIDARFFRQRLQQAFEWRKRRYPERGALRLINAESDGLPGVIVDRYGQTLVLQLATAGADYWRKALVAALVEATAAARIYERSDSEVRALEGLAPRTGFLHGDGATAVTVDEGGWRFHVDIERGQKTGFYLDQHDNRARVAALAAEKDVLDAFCYSGGFGVAALSAKARRVTMIDSSAHALALARANIELNGLPAERAEYLEADVFRQLRRFRDQRRSFDLIVLDPPKFAPTAAQAQQAARGYKDINLLAWKLLRPGGWLATFSCSGGVDEALFRKIIAGAAQDAGVSAQVIERLQAPADHPVALNFPQGEYLKGLLCRIV